MLREKAAIFAADPSLQPLSNLHLLNTGAVMLYAASSAISHPTRRVGAIRALPRRNRTSWRRREIEKMAPSSPLSRRFVDAAGTSEKTRLLQWHRNNKARRCWVKLGLTPGHSGGWSERMSATRGPQNSGEARCSCTPILKWYVRCFCRRFQDANCPSIFVQSLHLFFSFLLLHLM